MAELEQAIDYATIIGKLEKVVLGGWLIANLTEEYILCSDRVVESLKLPGKIVSFREVVELVHPDDRERIGMGMKMLSIYGKVKSNLRIRQQGIPDRFHMARIQFGEVAEENGSKYAYGLIQKMDPEEDASFNWNILNTQYKELKYWQINVPRFLLMLTDNRKFKEVLVEILGSVLARFNADRSYLMEYDWKTQTRSCLYEEVGESVEKIKLQNVPTDFNLWWHKQLLNGEMVVVDDVKNIPDGDLKILMTNVGITSIMLVPMIEKGKTWGYMGVEFENRLHEWFESEQAWFQSIGHIASIGLALRQAYSRAVKEKKYLRHLQKNMPTGMEVYDRDGYLIDANQKAIDLLGFIDKDCMRDLNLNIFENTFIPLEKREALRRGENISCEIVYTETPFSEPFFKNTDGKPKNLILEASALYDTNGELLNYLVILSDHTQYIQTYFQLLEFQKMFSLVAEFSEVGFFRINLLDPQLGYEVTDQWFSNFNAEKPRNNLASGLIPDTMDPEDAAEIGRFLTAATDGKERQFHKQLRVLNKDGSLRWLRVHIKVVDYHPEKDQVVLFGLSVDVTQLKNVELKLIEAKSKAEESDQLKSAFLANMNHEIRTPLNAIVGFSNMIAADPTSEMNAEFASLVLKNNDLLLQIISDVLDLARIEAGIFEAVLTNTNLNEMCGEILTSFSSQCGTEIELAVNAQFTDLHVLCDRNRSVQILNKFMGNALKFTQKGKIEIGFEIIEDGPDHYVELYVSDTGIGMNPLQVKNCFEQFVKGNSFVQGAGLGLSVCKKLVDKLNGTIGVESQIGVGTRFWFRLPFMPIRKDDEVNDELTVLTPDGRKPVILIAEDTVINFLLISAMLRQYYTIIVVQNGQDAVRVHAEKSPDLILMDLKMPHMDGLEATRLIRQNDTLTPIVAITAFAFEYDKRAAIEAGCNYVLTKPIHQLQLRKIVKQLIETGDYVKDK